MGFPIRTTVGDIQAVCAYLSTKPTGATLKEAQAVLDKKRLDGRKLAALNFWGLIEEKEGKYKVTPAGRAAARDGGAGKGSVLAEVIRSIEPYRAIIERAAHRSENSLTATEVAAHWYDHFSDQVSASDKTLNDQAVCFLQLAMGADLGELIIGRRGASTRFEFSPEAIQRFIGRHSAVPSHVPPPKADETPAVPPILEEPRAEVPPSSPRELGQAIFIAHGKNKKPVEQLKKILEQFRIPYKVAVEEPNLGRPIGNKVREIMEACNCAILIFTADEEFRDKNGNVIWRPSENVAYELGAAGYLYDNRMVIMKEKDVSFPSNFRDIGYISFDKDRLEAKAMDILKELIGFGIVKVST